MKESLGPLCLVACAFLAPRPAEAGTLVEAVERCNGGQIDPIIIQDLTATPAALAFANETCTTLIRSGSPGLAGKLASLTGDMDFFLQELSEQEFEDLVMFHLMLGDRSAFRTTKRTTQHFLQKLAKGEAERLRYTNTVAFLATTSEEARRAVGGRVNSEIVMQFQVLSGPSAAEFASFCRLNQCRPVASDHDFCGLLDVISFALNNTHVIDFAMKQGGFSGYGLQGFV